MSSNTHTITCVTKLVFVGEPEEEIGMLEFGIKRAEEIIKECEEAARLHEVKAREHLEGINANKDRASNMRETLFELKWKLAAKKQAKTARGGK